MDIKSNGSPPAVDLGIRVLPLQPRLHLAGIALVKALTPDETLRAFNEIGMKVATGGGSDVNFLAAMGSAVATDVVQVPAETLRAAFNLMSAVPEAAAHLVNGLLQPVGIKVTDVRSPDETRAIINERRR